MKLDRLINTLIYIYFALFGVLSVIVLAFSLVTTICFRQYEQNDLYVIGRENIALLVISMAVLLISMAFMLMRTGLFDKAAVTGKSRKLRPGAMGAAMLAFAAVFSLFIVFSLNGRATNDALQLDGIINDFMQGDYGALSPSGYLGSYPFQLGYVMAGQLLYILAGPSNFLVYQFLNVASILMTMYFLYEITWEIWENERVSELMAFLGIFAWFLYVYSTFVYADIWSFAPQAAAIYLEIRYLKYNRKREAAGAGLCIAAASLLKSNCYVALIAMVLTMLISAARDLSCIARLDAQNSTNCKAGITDNNGVTVNIEKKTKSAAKKSGVSALSKIAVGICFVIMTMALSRAVNMYYVHASGIGELPGGVPATAYFEMGMQECEGKYGWYDGYNVSVLHENNNDSALANEAAKEDMKESIRYFREHPKYFVKFYLVKFLSQWGDPTCISMRELEESGRHVENQPKMAEVLIFGKGSTVMQWVMNVYHSIIYMGSVIYILVVFARARAEKRRKKADREGSAALISEGEAMLVMMVFGGMLFHQLWEASGRYTMRYYLYLLPLAAYGWHEAVMLASRRLRRKQGL